MKILRTLLLLASVFFCTGAHAVFTGNDLVKWAPAFDRLSSGDRMTTEESANFNLLVGYAWASAGMANQAQLTCIPDGVTTRQLVALVRKTLDAEPDQWHRPGYFFVVKALVKAYPCDKK